MEFFRWKFEPKLWTTVMTLCFITATVLLGNWQTHRAETKTSLQLRIQQGQQAPILIQPQLMDLESTEFNHVFINGEFLPKHTILLDNKVLRGIVGYHVLTPVRIEKSNIYVLVNRGWIQAPPSRNEMPQFKTPTQTIFIQGIAFPPSNKFLQLSQQTISGIVWENLDFSHYQKWSGLTLQPFIVQQINNLDDGITRIQQKPDMGIAKHLGYAFQWYALAVLAFIMYIVLNAKRKSNLA